MRRCGNRAQSGARDDRWRSRSIFTGSSLRVRPRRCEGAARGVDDDSLRVPELGETTFAVLRATPGAAHESSSAGDPPSNSSMSISIVAADRLRLLAKEARRVDVALELFDGTAR
jgi:hypothetical protein